MADSVLVVSHYKECQMDECGELIDCSVTREFALAALVSGSRPAAGVIP